MGACLGCIAALNAGSCNVLDFILKEPICFIPYGFIAVQDKQDAAVMSGCSAAQIESVVFYETVRFLGQLLHSLRGSGLCLFSAKQKMFLFCSSLSVDTLLFHSFIPSCDQRVL